MLRELVKTEVERARSARHRRLFVIVGSDDRRLVEGALEVLEGYYAAGAAALGFMYSSPSSPTPIRE